VDSASTIIWHEDLLQRVREQANAHVDMTRALQLFTDYLSPRSAARPAPSAAAGAAQAHPADDYVVQTAPGCRPAGLVHIGGVNGVLAVAPGSVAIAGPTCVVVQTQGAAILTMARCRPWQAQRRGTQPSRAVALLWLALRTYCADRHCSISRRQAARCAQAWLSSAVARPDAVPPIAAGNNCAQEPVTLHKSSSSVLMPPPQLQPLGSDEAAVLAATPKCASAVPALLSLLEMATCAWQVLCLQQLITEQIAHVVQPTMRAGALLSNTAMARGRHRLWAAAGPRAATVQHSAIVAAKFEEAAALLAAESDLTADEQSVVGTYPQCNNDLGLAHIL
jgi:hypothetical protein